MKEQIIAEIMRQMLPHLDNAQMEQLREVLGHCLWNVEIVPDEGASWRDEETNEMLLARFISAKRVEGCSEKTLKYYQATLLRFFGAVTISVTHMTTDDLRDYLSVYQQERGCSKSNIDNIRRILSSFFSWLEDENVILKSPVRRIHKIKSSQTVKETYTDEALEMMRDHCGCLRDLAMIDLLASTGMRVGDADGKISLNQQKPSKHAGLRRFGPEKFLQRNNEFMKERPIFYKKPIKTEKDFSTWLRCFYYTTKAVITEYTYF